MDAQELRRLLELAAKAAGIGPVLCYESARNCLRIGNRESYTLWRPLTDDGDSRRLAVKLKFSIHVFDSYVLVETGFDDGGFREASDDLNAALRLAVLRAAASIGEKMGKEKN